MGVAETNAYQRATINLQLSTTNWQPSTIKWHLSAGTYRGGEMDFLIPLSFTLAVATSGAALAIKGSHFATGIPQKLTSGLHFLKMKSRLK